MQYNNLSQEDLDRLAGIIKDLFDWWSMAADHDDPNYELVGAINKLDHVAKNLLGEALVERYVFKGERFSLPPAKVEKNEEQPGERD